MDNMNTSINQDSIDSLNEFIAKYELERDARKVHEAAMSERVDINNMATIAKDLLELACKCLAGLAKFVLVAFILLSPYILEAIIDKWL